MSVLAALALLIAPMWLDLPPEGIYGPATASAPAVRLETPTTTSAWTVWDDLAECESGGNWAINTGNGYYGGIQFSLTSWRAVGGTGYPHHHPREEQIHRGERLKELQGWGAWPACSRKLRLR